jgi:hypothetical protein
MIAKFKRSWELFKASVTVTLRHRKLLWFPVLTGCLTTVIALVFRSAMALPVALHHTGYRLTQKEHWVALKDYYLPRQAAIPTSPDVRASDALRTLLTGRPAAPSQPRQPVPAWRLTWGSAAVVVIYFGSMFLATFFNVAFYAEIIAALDGRGVSLRRGLAAAGSRWRSILAWSLLAGLVGWLIRTLERRLPLVGRIIAGLIGLAWSIAAVFVIPVIVQQPMRNPVEMLRQSALTLKRTWGEGLIGYVGFSAGSIVIFLCSLPPLLLAGALAFAFKSWGLIIIAGAVWVLALLLIAYVSGVAGHVYRCALYKYATEGVVPEPYDQDLLDMAWKVKKSVAA